MEVRNPAPTRARKQQSHITNNATWSAEEDALLIKLVQGQTSSTISWSALSKEFPNKTAPQLAGRWCKVLNPDLVKGSWTPAEDDIIRKYVAQNGEKDWSKLASMLNGRTGKQCRERFKNHLDPSVQHSPWTPEEDEKLIKLHEEFGNQWTKIASMFSGRSDNCVKNRWNSTLKKRLERIQKGVPLVMKRGRKPKGFVEQTSPVPEIKIPTESSFSVISPISSPIVFQSQIKPPVIELLPLHESFSIFNQNTRIGTIPNLQENRLNLQRMLSQIV